RRHTRFSRDWSSDVCSSDLAHNENFTQTNPYRTRYLRPAKWLSAIRQGNTVTTYSSDDGLCWNLRTKETITLSGSVLIGVALTRSEERRVGKECRPRWTACH